MRIRTGWLAALLTLAATVAMADDETALAASVAQLRHVIGDWDVVTEFLAADGKTAQLRFTRFDVTAGSFESRMESTTDGGETWVPGNHQVFSRRE